MKRKVLALFMAASVAVSSLPVNALTVYGSEATEDVQLLGEDTNEVPQPVQASGGEEMSGEEQQARTEALTQTQSDSKTETPAEPESKPAEEASAESESEPVTETSAKQESEPVTEAFAEPESGAAMEAPAESESEITTEASTESESEITTEIPAESGSEPATEALTESKSEPATEASTELKSEPATEASSEPQRKAMLAETPERASITAPDEIVSVSVEPGGSVLLESKAEGEGALTHQWYGPDGMIVGATESTYTLQCPSSDGEYFCITSNGTDQVHTRYSVTVDTGFEILWEETTDDTYVVPYGSDFELKIAATVKEGCTLHYTWEENGEEILEARDQANYMVQDIRTPRYFDCLVNDGYGTAGTHQTGFTMTVVPDTLTAEAVSDRWPKVKKGEPVTFQVEASTLLEGGSINYTWYRETPGGEENELLSAFTGNSCTIDSVTESGNYMCSISDGCEEEVIWFYLTLKPVFEFDYGSMETTIQVKPEESFLMEVKTIAEEGAVLRYAWEDADGNPIGENSPTLSLQAGFENTQYSCTVTDQNDVSDTTSFNIQLDTLKLWNITDPFIIVTPGSSVILQVGAESVLEVPTITYEWYAIGETGIWEEEPISGETKDTLTIDALDKAGRYGCKVSDGIETELLAFDVGMDTGFRIHHEEMTISFSAEVGETVELKVIASANPGVELFYQWSDGNYAAIPGAVSDTLSVQVGSGDSQYSCLVKDSYGNSNVVYFYVSEDTLTVENDLWDGGSTIPIEAALGERRELSVNATSSRGQDAISYTWSQYMEQAGGFVELEGEHTAVLVLEPGFSSGTYQCEVTDGHETGLVEFSVTVDSGLTVEEDYFEYEVFPGEDVILEVKASTKAGTLSYIWKKYNWAMMNETVVGTNRSTFLAEQVTEPQIYSCDVSDNYNNTITVWYHLNLQNTVDLQYDGSSDWQIKPGETAELAVKASSKVEGVSLQYEWYQMKEVENEEDEVWEKIEGVDSDHYSASPSCSTNYRCCVADGYTKSELRFSVSIESGFSVTAQEEYRADLGTDVLISVKAESDYADQLTYQWEIAGEQGWNLLEGANSESYQVENLPGNQYYRCIVSDGYNEETVRISVLVDSQLTAKAAEELVEAEQGETAVLAVEASSKYGPITYEWTHFVRDEDVWEYLEEKESSLTVQGTGTMEVYRCDVLDSYQNASVFITLCPKEIKDQTAVDFDSAKTISAETPTNAVVALMNGQMYFKFVPEKTGLYSIYSSGEGDTEAYLYGADRQEILYNDDGENAEGFNFELRCELMAGETYYIAAGYLYGDCGIFPVTITYTGDSHHWDQGTVIQPATCVEDGILEFRCQDPGCGEVKRETIPATGAHTWKTVVDKKATCGAAGSQHKECSVCHKKETATTIPATGAHTWTTVVDKKATCGAAGSQHKECSVCHKKETATAIPATGAHTFGSWYVSKEATVLNDGLDERKCTGCGKTETAVKEKLNPTLKLNATKITLKVKQSTTKVEVTGLAKGDKVVSWKSSNPKIVKVDQNGKITAQKKTGKATLTVTLASKKSAKVTVTVQKGTVKTTKISGLKSKLTLAKGKTAVLKPVLNPITSTEKITYKSSNKKVVSVNSKGVIKALKAGTATITVKSGSKKFNVKVTVPKVKTTSIRNLKTSYTIKRGKTLTLKPKCNPGNSEEGLTYKSSNSKIVTVSSKGKIKAKKKGKAYITVRSGNVSVKVKIVVK